MIMIMVLQTSTPGSIVIVLIVKPGECRPTIHPYKAEWYLQSLWYTQDTDSICHTSLVAKIVAKSAKQTQSMHRYDNAANGYTQLRILTPSPLSPEPLTASFYWIDLPLRSSKQKLKKPFLC